jgi:cytochrome c-type biogenesis protein CcmH/NrfG
MPLARIAVKAAKKIPWKDIRTGAAVLWDFYDRWQKSRAKANQDRASTSSPRREDPAAITKRLDKLEEDVATTMQALRADLEQFSTKHSELAAAGQIVSARVIIALVVAGVSLLLTLGLLVWFLVR